MKIATRIKPENENQKHYKLQWQSAFGKTVLETFITDKEAEKYTKAGILCEQL
jgi:hypothetical protein